MTTFGFHSESTSSARQRMEAAGHAFEKHERIKRLAGRVRTVPRWQRVEAKRARLVALAEQRRREIQMELEAYKAEKVYRAEQSRLTMRDILVAVSERTGISKNDILSERRNEKIVAARHECFWLCRRKTTQSYPQIGKFFGGRDHTTVLHGVRKYQAMLDAKKATQT